MSTVYNTYTELIGQESYILFLKNKLPNEQFTYVRPVVH